MKKKSCEKIQKFNDIYTQLSTTPHYDNWKEKTFENL